MANPYGDVPGESTDRELLVASGLPFPEPRIAFENGRSFDGPPDNAHGLNTQDTALHIDADGDAYTRFKSPVSFQSSPVTPPGV